MKYAVIRDDDLNFYTSVSQFKASYGNLIKNYPTSFAIIPFAHPNFQLSYFNNQSLSRFDNIKNLAINEMNMDVLDLQEYFLNYTSIFKNLSLIEELKNCLINHDLEFMLHGITHQYFSEGPEFKYLNISPHDLNLSRRFLEEGFDTKINFFVPPSNSLSSKNLFVLVKSGFDILKSGSFNGDTLISRIIINFLKFPKILRKLRKLVNPSFLYLDYFYIGKSICVSSGSFVKIDNLESYIKRNKINYGDPILISTHYNDLLDLEYKKSFVNLLEEIKSEGYEFLTISELLRKMKLR